jgi:hypothetical protein
MTTVMAKTSPQKPIVQMQYMMQQQMQYQMQQMQRMMPYMQHPQGAPFMQHPQGAPFMQHPQGAPGAPFMQHPPGAPFMQHPQGAPPLMQGAPPLMQQALEPAEQCPKPGCDGHLELKPDGSQKRCPLCWEMIAVPMCCSCDSKNLKTAKSRTFCLDCGEQQNPSADA